ncbi:LLM class F420-dependent oxidoreductase [Nocardia huaxiensis]|uniref:LLM class F420-dependent oxidoreductase n=1 Tax=Nocardia huaxiensis TaxID=2755382 RepID=UPI001E2B676D|nr:LLM class F420-dependent oxidoreductase [Nocardia huaxiensis]UFS98004.1 LLM class F420-dependent oxidoreductase [Nocardia huaxiensis]
MRDAETVLLAIMVTTQELGKIGVWQAYSVFTPESVRELEQLGYGTVWLGASPDASWDGYDALLAATDSLTIGSSIVNVWASPSAEAAETFHRLDDKYPGRFVLGIGAGHREHTADYTKPYDALAAYLDDLDTAGVPQSQRALAALGPRVAKLARDRTAGALPYLTVPEHTAALREQLGPHTLIAPEHKVVFDTDPDRARATARETLGYYLGLSNYTANLRRYGFGDDDLTAPGSDRFIDAVAAHGTAEQIADRLTDHLRAGADHVAVQVLGGDPLPALRALAPALAERTK